MSYETKSLNQIFNLVNQTLFLPHIQRAFVWKPDQMCRLFDSLMRNYPIQTFLFWKTKDFIKTRRFMDTLEWDSELSHLYDELASQENFEKIFVLDGQQRLQTLYSVFKGAILIDEKICNAYFDITSGSVINEDDLLYSIVFSDIQMDLPFIRLNDFLTKHQRKDAVTLSEEISNQLDKKSNEDDIIKSARKSLVFKNCNKINELLFQARFFWFEELDSLNDPNITYEKVVDIFVRVNNGGTKLDGGDLMFAAIKGQYIDFEANVENIVDLLNTNTELSFDKFFVLKCISLAMNRGSQLNPKKFNSAEGRQFIIDITANWQDIENAFEELRDFITHDLMLFKEKVIRSYTSFVVLFDYLYHNPKPNPADLSLMKSYYYKSQLFNWYSAQTDSILDVLHGHTGQKEISFPLPAIKNYFKESRRKSIDLEKKHLFENRLRYILLNLIYVDKFGISPFDVAYNENEPNIDHIYPKSKLSSKLGLAPNEINHLGNYRFLFKKENNRKRAQLPDSYFNELKNAGISIDKHLLLQKYSNDPNELKFDIATYREFRDKRLDEIFKITSGVVNK